MDIKSNLKRLWAFLHEDSWQSLVVSLLLIVVLIKFIFFPSLSFITSSSLPLVVVESCSMYHESSFETWWNANYPWYLDNNIPKSKFEEFPFKNGLNKGDIIFVWGRSNYKLGDIIIFQPNPDSGAMHPIIHRIVTENPLGTKGDHNLNQLTLNNNREKIDETTIPEDRIIGKSALRIPFIGWIKLIFFEPFRTAEQRGFCN